jgi:hypothetical protein
LRHGFGGIGNNPDWLLRTMPVGDRLAGMEFSYIVSEADFRQAWRLERRTSSRSSFKTAAFWISIMICLLMLYKAIQPNRQQSPASSHLSVSQTSVNQPAGQVTTLSDSLQRVGPFLVIAGVWIIVVTGLVPMRLRYLYRRDPRMKGQFTVKITPNYITTENTAGTSSRSAWNVYEYWCEGKNVIVLMFHSGAYSILSLGGLSSPQRDELRSILTAALARR